RTCAASCGPRFTPSNNRLPVDVRSALRRRHRAHSVGTIAVQPSLQLSRRKGLSMSEPTQPEPAPPASTTGRRAPALRIAGCAVALTASLAAVAPAFAGPPFVHPGERSAATPSPQEPCGNGDTEAFMPLCGNLP